MCAQLFVLFVTWQSKIFFIQSSLLLLPQFRTALAYAEGNDSSKKGAFGKLFDKSKSNSKTQGTKEPFKPPRGKYSAFHKTLLINLIIQILQNYNSIY